MISRILFIILILITGIRIIQSIYLGGIPFWYDPARDLTLALEGFSFAGQPAGGIAGVLYPPFWLWAIGLILRINPDPRLVSFTVLALPYLTILPVILWKLRPYLGNQFPFYSWLLISINYNEYFSQIWNPHLEPLMFFCLFLAIAKLKTKIGGLLVGIFCTLTMSFHFSVGGAIVLGTALYMLLTNRHIFGYYILGLAIPLVPSFIYELQNNFIQTRSIIFPTAAHVADSSGLKKVEILGGFLHSFIKLFSIPTSLGIVGIIITLGLIIYKALKGNTLAIFLILNVTAVALIFLLGPIPIRPYHFIGVEILAILAIGVGVANLKFVNKLPIIISVMVLGYYSYSLVTNPIPSFAGLDTLNSKIKNVREILDDMNNNQSSNSIVIYNKIPWSNSYEYEYIFNWLKNEYGFKKLKFNTTNGKFVYVVFPEIDTSTRLSHLEMVTPSGQFGTMWEKPTQDHGFIVKRDNRELDY